MGSRPRLYKCDACVDECIGVPARVCGCECVHRREHRTLSPPTSDTSSPPDPQPLKGEHPESLKSVKYVRLLTSGHLNYSKQRPPIKTYSILFLEFTGLVPVSGLARSDQAAIKVQCGRLAGLGGL